MSNGKLSFEFFDFHQGALGKRDDEIIEALSGTLLRCDPGNAIYKIQIVDTAIGGHGIVHLASLLRHVHDSKHQFRNQYWDVEAHLIHPPTAPQNLDRMRSAGVSEAHYSMAVTLHQVDDLIVEDFDAAMGFKLEYDGTTWFAKPSIRPGRFLLKGGGASHLVNSENLYLTFTDFLSQSATENLLTDPNRTMVGVVWDDYTQKL